jgi:SAM-dependent methyltransferase
VISTHPRLTGERPQQGVTPDSLLALHDAGYRAVVARLGAGRVLDVGCGNGFESVRLTAPGRRVVGVDYSGQAAAEAARTCGQALAVACSDAEDLGIATGAFDWVCSSHVIEHFADPSGHAAEMARVCAEGGTAFILTPNAPADFENPFHLTLFDPGSLAELLGRFFREVWVGGVDAPAPVKADFAARRAKAQRLLALDVLNLRRRMPRRWYVALYTRLLPVAYRLLARRDTGGATGITADDWFVTDVPDPTTLVLFAVCRQPRPRPSRQGRRAP